MTVSTRTRRINQLQHDMNKIDLLIQRIRTYEEPASDESELILNNFGNADDVFFAGVDQGIRWLAKELRDILE